MLSTKSAFVTEFVIFRRSLDVGIIDGNIVEITSWSKTRIYLYPRTMYALLLVQMLCYDVCEGTDKYRRHHLATPRDAPRLHHIRSLSDHSEPSSYSHLISTP